MDTGSKRVHFGEVEERAPRQRSRRHLKTITDASEESRDCWLRLPGMSEKTKVVWLAERSVEVMEATMGGVRVRLPADMVRYWNAGDDVGDLDAAEEVMQEVQKEANKELELQEKLEEGKKLHDKIGKDMWCVTLDDLRELRDLVTSAVEGGLIKGDFDKDDLSVGPDIHTVNEQFIKPVTRLKGGMSWALMKHEQGLKCDLFITHSWNEGIFEFLNKVIASWPSGAKNAYCCMLANPQNLNIGSIIGTPSESPFAKSLEVAPTMMVVPNSKSSIYTRLWCVYEAYLAYEDNKFIFTARPPMLEGKLYRLLILAGFSTWGSLQRYMAEHGFVNNGTWLSPLAFVLLTLVAGRSSPEKYVYCCVGTRDAWYVITACIHEWLHAEFEDRRTIKSVGVFGTMYALFSLYFFIAAIDHISATCDKVASDELKRGYRGSVRHASCSRKGDEDAINGEINRRYREKHPSSCPPPEHQHGSEERKEGEAFKALDRTIDLLIDAGMSTEHLRAAKDKDVKLQEVGHVQWGATVIALIWTVPFWFNGHADALVQVGTKAIVACDLLTSAFIVKSLACKAWDERVVAVACLQKLHIYLPFFGCLAAAIEKYSEERFIEVLCAVAAALGLVTKLLCAYLIRMDLAGIQERLGSSATQFLVTYGFGVTRGKAYEAWKCIQKCGAGCGRRLLAWAAAPAPGPPAGAAGASSGGGGGGAGQLELGLWSASGKNSILPDTLEELVQRIQCDGPSTRSSSVSNPETATASV